MPRAAQENMIEIAAGLPIKQGKFLLGWRSAHRKAFPSCWDLIGGHVEANETTEQALVREFQEEVGITPTTFEFVTKFETPDGVSDRILSLSVYRITAWAGGEPKIRNDEHERLGWFTGSEAANLPDFAVGEYKRLFASLDRHP